ncbi:undecaprenyl/decaprenyl-phosphate alpha-N-acetylglucosaminyl 1-phosphate transferase [Sulfurovum sp. XGS-02]|uniref:MraY family glycosyltransferase n=1 Tax=Sulfurovum sp. XGS-02 TaxID=2925411 RepID=UPI00206A520B|nr:MraY family glycosyltransferase [Sulfurovum sp. XGS-02]UPT76803.1 undecaprenyl/decaprenyl-phosphate alpha-N-acetylglucosaminyl 1-phosphate transferase [Sulfurovum sp. XGS-02]
MDISLLSSIFLTSLAGMVLLMIFAKRVGLIDIPNERSVHKKPIPRGAGVAFVMAIVITLFLFDLGHLKTYYYIYAAIGLVFVAGVWDDLQNISPKVKFIFIFFSSLILYLNDVAIFSLGTYLGYEIILPGWLVFPFTFFAIAGYTNALNLMDGLDGLAASISIVILVTFLAIGLVHGDAFIILLSSCFIVTLLAFLLFNWNPAKVFMGDSGSLSLGMVISILGIQSTQYITPISILFIVALPVLDTFIVMIRRMQRHISPFHADKNHMHHFLFNVKGDIRYTVIILAMMQMIFSIIGYQVSQASDFLSLILFILLFSIYLNLFDQRLKRRH